MDFDDTVKQRGIMGVVKKTKKNTTAAENLSDVTQAEMMLTDKVMYRILFMLHLVTFTNFFPHSSCDK